MSVQGIAEPLTNGLIGCIDWLLTILNDGLMIV